MLLLVGFTIPILNLTIVTSVKTIQEESILEINDFSDFRNYYYFNDYIVCENNNSYFYLKLNDSLDFGSYNYLFSSVNSILAFNEFGSTSNFSISIVFDYYYLSEFGEFRFIAGTYNSGYSPYSVAYCLIRDLDDLDDGSFVIGAAHSDGSSNKIQSGLQNNGTIVFSISRTISEISCSIKYGSSIVVSQTWGQLYDQPINYFQLAFQYNAPKNELFFINATSISGSLTVDGVPVDEDPFGLYPNDNILNSNKLKYILWGITTGILIIAIVFLIIRNRMLANKKEIIRDDPQLYQKQERFSEDFLESVVSSEVSGQQLETKTATILDNSISQPKILKDNSKKYTCSICKIEIKVGSEIFECPFCKSYFHKEHYIQWVSTKGKCPVCKKSLIEKK